MVEATAEHTRTNGNSTKVRFCVQQEETKSESTSRPFLDRSQIELVDAVLTESSKREYETKREVIYSNQFDQSHFAELVVLAYELGLTEEVESLLSQKNHMDVNPFLTQVSNQLRNKVTATVMSTTKTLTDDLFSLLVANGIEVDYAAYKAMVKATMSEHLGSLAVGITSTDNYNFDCDDNLTLNISSDDTSLFIMTDRKGELAQSVRWLLRERSQDALLMGCADAIIDTIPDYSRINEYLDWNLDADSDVEQLYKILETNHYFYEFDFDDDEDELKERTMALINEIIEIKKSSQKQGDTFLSQWFEKSFRKVDFSAIESQSHAYPYHFVTDNKLVIDSLNDAHMYYIEECDSRLHLEPSKAVETLVNIGINRSLYLLFDAIACIGYEDEINTQFLSTHNLQITKQRIL